MDIDTGDLPTVRPGAAMTVRLPDQDVLAALPESARDFADYLGLDRAVEALRRIGGQRLCVSKSSTSPSGMRLVALVGLEAAEAIVELYGGQSWEVPLLARIDCMVRTHEIRRQFQVQLASGIKRSQIIAGLTQRFGVTDRTARKIVAGIP
jgi:hypothetical protein